MLDDDTDDYGGLSTSLLNFLSCPCTCPCTCLCPSFIPIMYIQLVDAIDCFL